MSKQLLACLMLVTVATSGLASRVPVPDTRGVAITNRTAERRVDISIDGQPFTSYIYPQSFEKPVLYPIRSAAGLLVTRGYPLDPRPGERADHPHHVGHWFNYGDVNGYDFWGNSSETAANLKPKTGVIVQKAISRAAGGDKSGELSITADWIIPDGSVLLQERTRFIFADSSARPLDHSTARPHGRRPARRSRSTTRKRARSGSASRDRSIHRYSSATHSWGLTGHVERRSRTTT